MSDANAPTPDRIMQMMGAYQASAALKGALDLGLFTALSGETRSAASLAEAVEASEKGVRILCDFLVIGGLLEKEGAAYRSSPDAALFLDEASPAYFGSVTKFLLGDGVSAHFSDLAAVVRKGGTLMDGQGLVATNHDAKAPLKVLDIAAGHGVFGATIAARLPRAEVVALDWPAVLEVATENAAKAGVSGRHTLLPGSAFDTDFGDGYDVVLLTNFLHHFDAPTCTDLLRKVHAALNDGGRAVTLEFVPNEDRVSPPDQASFALVMLATTAEGDAYTFSELEAMAADAGFSGSEMHRMQGSPQTVIVSTK